VVREPQASRERYEEIRREWLNISRRPPVDFVRFEHLKGEAAALVEAGLWASGPSDMLTVMGRQRDELLHSRVIGWLLVPTNRHGLGRAALTEFVDALWPNDGLMRTGPVVADLEVPASAFDDEDLLREARADIVVRCEGVTLVIENKLDAGEQADQCERLYWAWAAEPGDVRWVFLTPTGRSPVTATSDAARAAWRTLSYRQLKHVVTEAIESAMPTPSLGRSTAMQYLETLSRSVTPKHE
jgi:hypothetical protein